jgi:uncharacterized protein YjlB
MSLNALASPMLHLGGTSATELLAQHREVLNAARALEHAIIAASPHIRDYAMMGMHAGQEQYDIDLLRNAELRFDCKRIATRAELTIANLLKQQER